MSKYISADSCKFAWQQNTICQFYIWNTSLLENITVKYILHGFEHTVQNKYEVLLRWCTISTRTTIYSYCTQTLSTVLYVQFVYCQTEGVHFCIELSMAMLKWIVLKYSCTFLFFYFRVTAIKKSFIYIKEVCHKIVDPHIFFFKEKFKFKKLSSVHDTTVCTFCSCFSAPNVHCWDTYLMPLHTEEDWFFFKLTHQQTLRAWPVTHEGHQLLHDAKHRMHVLYYLL